MEYQDYYQTLGLARTASQAEIKKAFRRLARANHPDANQGDATAERRFKLINEANAVLSDPAKRKKYDALGANWEAFSRAGATGSDAAAAGGPFAGFGGAGRSGNVRYEFRTAGGGEFTDFFRTFFAGDAGASSGGSRRTTNGGPSFEEILAQMGLNQTASGDRAAGARRSPGPTAEAIAEIDLEEAFRGTTRRVEVGGKRLEVTIPQGADNGTRVKLSGQGPDGGDLMVTIKVRPHRVFTRRGPDLERELPITLSEALLGAEVPVTTLKGRVLLTIPPATQTGRLFRLKGQGMPRLRADGSGDLLARTKLVLPTALEAEAEEAARRFLALVDQPDPRSS